MQQYIKIRDVALLLHASIVNLVAHILLVVGNQPSQLRRNHSFQYFVKCLKIYVNYVRYSSRVLILDLSPETCMVLHIIVWIWNQFDKFLTWIPDGRNKLMQPNSEPPLTYNFEIFLAV